MTSLVGNLKSSKTDKNIDQYGRVVYDIYDMYDMVLSGLDVSAIKEVSWNEDFENIIRHLKRIS